MIKEALTARKKGKDSLFKKNNNNRTRTIRYSDGKKNVVCTPIAQYN